MFSHSHRMENQHDVNDNTAQQNLEQALSPKNLDGINNNPEVSRDEEMTRNSGERVNRVVDDNGVEVKIDNNKFSPKTKLTLYGVEYRTDDNGKIYSANGVLFSNKSYVLDGTEYKTDDNGEVYCVTLIIPEKKGGSYKDIKVNGEGEKYEVHHMPSDSASTNLERGDGPAIKMDKEDHRQTASCGMSREAREYREKQRELIEQGKFREALQMDIDDIHDKFGTKYDDAIAQMLEYVDQLEEEGKI